MFSNGSEYEEFLDRNCYECKHFVPYDEVTEKKPVCRIEESIAMGMDEYFPYKWLDENGTMARYDCRKRLGLDAKLDQGVTV